MQILATRIKELREEKGLSQKQAAQALFISNTSLSNYELNISTPSPETLVEICNLYNVSMDFLFGITDTKYRINSLSNDETQILNNYSKLNERRKNLICEIVKELNSR